MRFSTGPAGRSRYEHKRYRYLGPTAISCRGESPASQLLEDALVECLLVKSAGDERCAFHRAVRINKKPEDHCASKITALVAPGELRCVLAGQIRYRVFRKIL